MSYRRQSGSARRGVVGILFDAADPAAAGVVEVEARLNGIDVLVCSVAADARPELLHEVPPEKIGSTGDG